MNHTKWQKTALKNEGSCHFVFGKLFVVFFENE